MNALLWIIQVPLALLYLAGGGYKAFQFAEVAKQFTAIPLDGWRILGLVEMIGGLLLLAPAAMKWLRPMTPLAAWILTLESAAISGIYASVSLEPTAKNPLLWSGTMAVLTAFVAWGRSKQKPKG